LLDGLSSREEMVLAALSAALGDIPHFGGSAGDDNYLTHTHVYFDGEFHSGAAVVVLVNTWLDFEVFTTHHILPGRKNWWSPEPTAPRAGSSNSMPSRPPRSTRGTSACRGRPRPPHFAAHPLAVRIHDQYYVRAIQQVHDDLSLSFYCAVENGIVLTAMTPGRCCRTCRACSTAAGAPRRPAADHRLRLLPAAPGTGGHGSLEQIGAFLREQRVMGSTPTENSSMACTSTRPSPASPLPEGGPTALNCRADRRPAARQPQAAAHQRRADRTHRVRHDPGQ
jgi:hypothetical protein